VVLLVVLQGRDEFYTSRLAHKERRPYLVEELLADIKAQTYTKRKYSAIQDKVQKTQNSSGLKRKKMGLQVWLFAMGRVIT
jgi:hypothetical protein